MRHDVTRQSFVWLLALAIWLVAAGADAQIAIDCSGGCRVDVYGLHADNSYDREPFPADPFAYDHDDFDGSYLYIRSTGLGGADCGVERAFAPLFGQFWIREQANCVPTLTEGCPVEMAVDVVEQGTEHVYSNGFQSVTPTSFGPIWISAAVNGDLAGTGLRFARPDGSTEIRWTLIQNGTGDANRSLICCNDLIDGALCAAGALSKYPVITDAPSLAFNQANMAPWIFEGGPGTPFAMDEDFEIPGQQFGVCRNNRTTPCTAGGNECAGLADTCDLRERGWRFQPNDVLADGSPNAARCNTAPFVFRGFPSQNCSIIQFYPVSGDPGPDCAVRNYGPYFQPDLDCDGVLDGPDLCPFYSEIDQVSDTNGDGRGDECQCGDSNRDGVVDVSDLIQSNSFIFNDPGAGTAAEGNNRLSAPLADTNFDDELNVVDLLGTNEEIFSPGLTATCGRSPQPGQ
jgi:hypothetical protein